MWKALFWMYITVVSAVSSIFLTFFSAFMFPNVNDGVPVVPLVFFCVVIPLVTLFLISKKKMMEILEAWMAESPTKSAKADLPPIEEEEETEAGVDVDAILGEIDEINCAISDKRMSEQISHIQDITQKILSYQEKRPEKAPQLHSFLDYFLPATLKILRAYGNLEEQGISGENITGAMKRIERMMDTVRQGFDKQLDLLYQGEAMDIATDVDVLEQMMAKDGLIVNQDLSLHLEPGQDEKTENAC